MGWLLYFYPSGRITRYFSILAFSILAFMQHLTYWWDPFEYFLKKDNQSIAAKAEEQSMRWKLSYITPKIFHIDLVTTEKCRHTTASKFQGKFLQISNTIFSWKLWETNLFDGKSDWITSLGLQLISSRSWIPLRSQALGIAFHIYVSKRWERGWCRGGKQTIQVHSDKCHVLELGTPAKSFEKLKF